MKKIIVLPIIAAMIGGCDQFTARNLGGTDTVELDKNQRLVEITWKDQNLWILTEPMDSDYIPQTKTFYENSLIGVMQGKIIIKESK